MRHAIFYIFLLFVLNIGAQKPTLVLPTLHTNPILDMSFSVDGALLVTTSINEVKLWESGTGKLILTILGRKNEGYAAAEIAPNKQLLLTTGNCFPINGLGSQPAVLRLWEVGTGQELRPLQALPTGFCVTSLAISPKSSLAAISVVTDKGLSGTVVYNLKNGKEVNRFIREGKASFSADEKQLIFQESNSLTAVSINNGKEDQLLAEGCLDFSIQKDTLCVLTMGKSIKKIHLPSKRLIEKFFTGTAAASWSFRSSLSRLSSDGKQYLKVFDQTISDPGGKLRRYRFQFSRTADRSVLRDIILEDSLDAQLISSPDLQLLVAAPYLTDDMGVFDVAPNIVAYSLADGSFRYDFGLERLRRAAKANFFPPRFEVYNEGRLILIRRSPPNHSSVFLTQTGQLFPIASETDLSKYTKGEDLKADSRWEIKCEDGISYHLYDAQSEEALAVLLIAEPDIAWQPNVSNTWAITTPSGLFDASPDMMQDLHYVVNTEIIELDQLKERYYEPRLLAKIFGLNEDAIRQADGLEQVDLYPEIEATLDTQANQLLINLTPRDGGIGQLSLYIGGKEAAQDVNPERKKKLNVNLSDYAHRLLPNQDNTIQLLAYNKAGWLKSGFIPVRYPEAMLRARGSTSNTATVSLGDNPSLYAIVVGTSNYQGDALDLKFADRDATYFSQAIRATAPGIFENRTHVYLLNTDPNDPLRINSAEKENIQNIFDDIATKAKAQDILMVYFSGHGVNYGNAENTQFYYLTKDVSSENLSDPAVRQNFAISSEELTTWINKIPALKQVMIFDACNAGQIVDDFANARNLGSSQIRALERMKDRTGMFILTGSAADKASFESNQFDQGLLTYSLLDGMRGGAIFEDVRIDVMTLFQHARNKVPNLAKELSGDQTPVLHFPKGGASFDIGTTHRSAEIPIASSKLVFIRSNFQEEALFSDVLGLDNAVANYLNQLTLGGQSPFVYAHKGENPDAYSIKGRYTLVNEEIALRARLFKGEKAQGTLMQISGHKNNLTALVQKLFRAVDRHL